MSRLLKFRAFNLKEIFVLFLARTFYGFSKSFYFSNDLKQYSKDVTNIISKGYNVIRIGKDIIEISNNKDVYLVRRYGSDIKVFEQIVIKEEYRHVLSLIDRVGLRDSILTIVDCGSNIGLFSAWIINNANVKKIVSIEADSENYIFQKYFIDKMQYESRIELLNKAIWSDSVSRLRISSDFRDGEQWAKSVVPANENNLNFVNSVSLNQVFDDYLDREIHILKIDIEGTEKVIFEKEESFDRLLKNTVIIAIEIHEEVECTAMILSILESYGFELEKVGETTFGYKNLN